MKQLLFLVAIFTSFLGRAQVGVSEYQAFFLKNGLWYGVGHAPNMGIGGSGTDGLPYRVITSPTNLQFSQAYGSIHGGSGIDVNTRFWVVGDNSQGEYANGTTTASNVASEILTDSAGNQFTGITSAASFFTLGTSVGWFAIKNDGTLWAWGQLAGGMRGNGVSSSANVLRPVQVVIPGGRKVVQITAGYWAIALCSDGTVWMWGNGILSPTQVTVPGSVTQIAGGMYWNYAVTSTGLLYGWGQWGAYMGLAASGAGPSVPTPVLLTGIMNALKVPIKQIAVNSNATYVILTDGTLHAWGDNSQGCIGNGQELNYAKTEAPYFWDGNPGDLIVQTPYQIGTFTDWVAIYTSPNYVYYAYFQRANGQLYSDGRNKGGVLGNGQQGAANGDMQSTYANANDVTVPTPVNPLGLTSLVYLPCPYCLTNPSGSPCSEDPLPAHVKPVANAGTSQTLAFPADSAILNAGGSSDPNTNGVLISYRWKQLSGPSASAISLTSLVSPTVYGLVPGTYVFQVTVTNMYYGVDSSAVQVTVTKQNTPPVAVILPVAPLTLPADTISLDGTASSDADGTIASYSWSLLSGPCGSTIYSSTGKATVVVQQAGTYVFQLQVTDNLGATSLAQASVVVNPKSCPICPPARTAVSAQITINGQVFTIPLNGILVKYSDGATQ